MMLRRRCEEAELAAAVGMRRASAAEEEAAHLRARLEEAQKEAKDLGWQVRVQGIAAGCRRLHGQRVFCEFQLRCAQSKLLAGLCEGV